MGVLQEAWLEDDDNLDRWTTGHFTASEQRVLIQNWLAAAVKKVNTSTNLWRYTQRGDTLRH